MDDVFNAGYELPDDLPGEVKNESFEYFRHPAGVYEGFIGKLVMKYKNANGDKVDATAPGAAISHTILNLWVKKYFGTSTAPVTETFLSDALEINPNLPLSSFYYPQMVTLVPQDQWKNIQLFETFKIPNNDKLRIIQINPQKPTEKYTVFKSFPAYYGCSISFEIVMSGKGNGFIQKITMLNKQWVPAQSILKLEQELSDLIQKDKAMRDSKDSGGYAPPPPPSFDDIFGEKDDLGEFAEQ
uniref:Uncharacterized protein n=1 Tax=viral metagenome TaxID=1070528 RepID=A0A6H1ZKA2_9ZZZZ